MYRIPIAYRHDKAWRVSLCCFSISAWLDRRDNVQHCRWHWNLASRQHGLLPPIRLKVHCHWHCASITNARRHAYIIVVHIVIIIMTDSDVYNIIIVTADWNQSTVNGLCLCLRLRLRLLGWRSLTRVRLVPGRGCIKIKAKHYGFAYNS